jgi:hypothetical protein
VGIVEENVTSDDDTKICVAKWVDTPKGKLMACAFLKPEGDKEEMKFMFDVSKCDKLFDILLQNNVIKLKAGHTIPTVEQLARKKYCSGTTHFFHTTNECNYFRRQIQSAINNDHLTLGDNHWMKVNVDPFLVDMINFEEKKVLVHSDQASMTRGKNVVVSDELRAQMMKPRNPEVGMWKRNMPRKSRPRWEPTSSFLMEKYVRRQWESVFNSLDDYKRERSLGYNRTDGDTIRFRGGNMKWRSHCLRIATQSVEMDNPNGEYKEKGD